MFRYPRSSKGAPSAGISFAGISLSTVPATGVTIALLILLVWAASSMAAFSIGAEALGVVRCVCLIPWLTFLYTGLFVTGHDAMHQSVAPHRPVLNRAIGELSLLLYGLIPYDKLFEAHAEHHRFPASRQDPDFHNGRHTHPVLWYFCFMRSYWTLRQSIGIVVIYNLLFRVMGVPEANLLMFWAIPSLLSSVQLFYFGTYLVHRTLHDTYSTPLCSNSNYWPRWLSFITCYHFGYHLEHHAYPEVPWWQLPRVDPKVCRKRAAHMTTANQRYASSGSALAMIRRPLVQRDRTRLKT
ncbi:MAG: fatty acid desaturase [Cyanobacteria bacterium J06649_5]